MNVSKDSKSVIVEVLVGSVEYAWAFVGCTQDTVAKIGLDKGKVSMMQSSDEARALLGRMVDEGIQVLWLRREAFIAQLLHSGMQEISIEVQGEDSYLHKLEDIVVRYLDEHPDNLRMDSTHFSGRILDGDEQCTEFAAFCAEELAKLGFNSNAWHIAVEAHQFYHHHYSRRNPNN